MDRIPRLTLLVPLLALLGAAFWLVWRAGATGPRSAAPAARPEAGVRPATPHDPIATIEPATPPDAVLAAPLETLPDPPEQAPEHGDLRRARGRVVDAGSGEGVPGLAVTVESADGAQVEELETDLEGTFVSQWGFPLRGTVAKVRDAFTGDGWLGDFERPFEPQAAAAAPPTDWVLPVAVGPTFRFRAEVEGPSPGTGPGTSLASSDLRARVIGVGQDASGAGTIDVHFGPMTLHRPAWLTPELEAQARARQAGQPPAYASTDPRAGLTGAALPLVEWPWLPVAGEEVFWTRYSRAQVPLATDLPDLRVRLEVGTVDGELSGEADLETTRGVHPGRLVVLLREPCTLSGRVVDRRGAPVADATVSLVREDTAASFAPWERTRSDGGFLLGVQRPGDWRLRVQTADAVPVERAVRLEPGDNALAPVVVPVVEGYGPVSGTLTCAAETERFLVLLESAVKTGFGRGSVITLPRPPDPEQAGAARTGTFAFEDVPEGTYALRVVPADPFLQAQGDPRQVTEWAGHVETVAVPGPPLELDCASSALLDTVGFRVTSARGVPIDRFEVGWGPGGALLSTVRAASWDASWQVPRGASLEWLVWDEGHQPRTGDERAFGGERPARLAHVALEPGWGARLFFREDTTADGPSASSVVGSPELLVDVPLALRAVAGVQVRVEGRVVATSDARGMALIALPSRPRTLELQCPGWAAVDLVRPPSPSGRAGYETAVWMLRM